MEKYKILENARKAKTNQQRRRFLVGATAATAAIAFAGQAAAKSLRLYTWPDYMGSATLEEFSAKTGIVVSTDAYGNSDEMLHNIDSSDGQYDILIASYDYVEEMIANNFLLPLDHSQIPNTVNLLPVFRDAIFDPGRRFSMPFLWGTQGICYRKSAVTENPDSWRILFESDAYSGRVALPGPDTLGLALKDLGYSYNSVDPVELDAAGELLIRQKPHVKSFVGHDGIELLANGDVDVTVGWNSEILELMENNDDFGYRVPIEGSLVWQDCICIPRTTANAVEAHTLLNHALDARVSATIAEELWYATPNQAALELLPDSYKKDHVIFPGMDIIGRCEPALNLGEAGTQLRNRIWEKVTQAWKIYGMNRKILAWLKKQ